MLIQAKTAFAGQFQTFSPEFYLGFEQQKSHPG
jgi:hypothetical protein